VLIDTLWIVPSTSSAVVVTVVVVVVDLTCRHFAMAIP